MNGSRSWGFERLSAQAVADAVARGETSAEEMARLALSRVTDLDSVLHAFLEVWPESALDTARRVDRRLARGENLPLAGVPIGVKGRRGADARAARRLIAAGGVPIGATSVPGPGTPWQTWGRGRGGRTVNPWRHDRVPGGSSAGSAVAVAAGMVPLATGSDGAGSVRIPAAWCGITGLKLTRGTLPSPDPSGLAASGVFVRDPADLSAYLRCVGTARAGVDTDRDDNVVPVTAVWSEDLGFGTPDRPVVEAAREAVNRCVASGLLRLVRPRTPLRLSDPAPAWLALRQGGDTESKELAAATRAANDARLAACFAAARLLLTPATPNPPHGHDGPGERYSTELTWSFNLSGHPALSVPTGGTVEGCPVGLQLVASHGREALLAAVARGVTAAVSESRT